MKKLSIVILTVTFLAISATAQDFESRLKACFSEVSSKNNVKAIELCTKLVEEKPDDYRAFYYRGMAYTNTGTVSSYEKAQADYKKCVEIYPKFADAHFLLGYVITVFDVQPPEKYDAAIKSFTQAISLSSDRKDVYYQRGEAYRKGADNLTDAARNKNWNSPETAQKAKGYRNSAIADYQKSLETNPTFNLATLKLGYVQNALEQYDAAITTFTKYIQTKPDDKTAYQYRGAAYFNLKKYQLAINDFDKALALNKTNFRSESEKIEFEQTISYLKNEAANSLKKK